MAWIPAAIMGGASLLGGVIQGQAAQSGASQQAQAAQNAQNISLGEFNTISAQQAPYMQSGYGALSALDWGLGITPQTYGQGTLGPIANNPYNSNTVVSGPNGQFPANPAAPLGSVNAGGGRTSVGGGGVPGMGFGSLTTPFTTQNWQQLSPMYNFNVQQGRQGVLSGDASGQGALSGAAAKDLINYNQSAANQSFGQAFNQYQTQQGNIFNRLSGIAGLGQAAAANTAATGAVISGNAANSAQNIGSALGGGTVGAANAYSGALSSAAPWLFAGGGGQQPQIPWQTGYDTSNTINNLQQGQISNFTPT